MKKLIYLVLILPLFFFCRHGQQEVERIIENGVEVVINHIEPYQIGGKALALNLEKEFVIDMERDDIAELGLGKVASFDIDSEENIYLWTQQSKEGYIFKYEEEPEPVMIGL